MPRPRCYLLAALALAAFAPVVVGDDAIPYDAKKARALAERRRAWLDSVTKAAYQAVGRKDPKWDADVLTAFRVNLDRQHGSYWDRPVAAARLQAALAFAVEAGCDDPLVGYLRLTGARGPAVTDDEDDLDGAEVLAAARALGASKYPAVWKAHAYLDAIAALRPGSDEVGPCQDALMKALADLATDKDPTARRELIELCERTHQVGHKLLKRKAWFDRVEKDVLATMPKTDPIPHLCAGTFLVRYAWDTRGGEGGKGANDSKEFKPRLAEAEKRLTAAWDLDKECAAAAVEMVAVCTGLGHNRTTMDQWFRRAVTADPTRVDVFDRKITYLTPKWHGKAEDVEEFGRQTAALGQWDTALPYYLLLATREAAPTPARDRETYFKSPDVWSDVGPVLEEIRKRHPNSPVGASLYLFFAWHAERNAAEAQKYVRAQKVPLSIGLFASLLHIESAKAWAEGKAGAKE